MDEGRAMTANELWKARALYIGHLLAVGLCMALTAYFADELNLLKRVMNFGDWMVFVGFFLAAGFVTMLVLNPLFRRKARPWHGAFSVPQEDRWPRAGSRHRSQ